MLGTRLASQLRRARTSPSPGGGSDSGDVAPAPHEVRPS
jgi:hypothetical protein